MAAPTARLRYPATAVIAWLLIAAIDASAPRPHHPDAAAAMERFLSRPILAHQYRAFRRLEAAGSGQRAWLDARTEFTPAAGMQYDVVGEGGSGYIRRHVLHALLEQEKQLIARGLANRAALDQSNYQFSPDEYGDDGLVRVLMRPLRKDRALIAGAMFLRPGDGELVRIEGQLAKNPSIWMKRVDVVRRYERLNGVLVPTSLESTAHLRLLGRSSLQMAYHYSEVDDRPVSSP
jgi:hypothetical protein